MADESTQTQAPPQTQARHNQARNNQGSQTPPTNDGAGKSMPPFDFTIEFGDDRNRNFLWPLDQRKLRGRWTRNNLPGVTFEGAPEFSNMPDLPGLRLRVNSVKRASVIFDPLENDSDPKVRKLLAKATTIVEVSFGTRCAPEVSVKLSDMNDDELRSHAYWARRFLDNRQCVEVAGQVPEMKQIEEMPGLIKFQVHDNSPLVVHDQPAPRRYVPVRFPDDDV